MILSDFHVHTTYCDGKNSPEDMVLAAVSLGMKKLGFSGHSYTPFDEVPCMSQENTLRYLDEIHRLKEKYSGQIEILCGTECDYYSDINPENYDYVIGSVHYIDCGGVYRHVDHTPEMLQAAIDDSFGGDPYALAEHYYSLVADVVRKTRANIIGHFDLITKLNTGNRFFDETHPRYVAAANSALDTLLKTGVPFEINTGAMSRGYRDSPYPSLRILKYIAEHGGSVILSSDSHAKNTLMYGFPKCESLAQSIGLKVCSL
ncbi:MAG: histidinol-phosphatase [Synergistaceae bacterium]|nr:histidinol-phosphatase [Synergistaceae bacterium]